MIFPADGAYPYKRDLKTVDLNILDTGHFALEEEGDFIASKILAVLPKYVGPQVRIWTAAMRAATVGPKQWVVENTQ